MKHVKKYQYFLKESELSGAEAGMSLEMIQMAQNPTTVVENIKALVNVIKQAGLKDTNAIIGLLCVMGKESGFTNVRETTKYLPNDKNWLLSKFPILKTYKGDVVSLKNNNQAAFYNLVYGPNTKPGKDFNHGPSDGYRYRGGGYTQLTGKKYYQYLGVTPEEIQTPAGAAKALKKSIELYAGSSPGNLKFKTPQEAITYFVNKVRGGSSDFTTQYNKAVKMLVYFSKDGKYAIPT